MPSGAADERNWKLLEREISKITGFDCSHYSESFLKRRVKSRLLALDTGSYMEYINLLNTKQGEKDLLLEELTIHVTNFFRNKDTFHVFIAETMMEFLKEKQKKRQKTIKIWSAGCSSGEEPYSIAMILLELLQDRINDFYITIIGTDISPSIIEKAKKGVYRESQLKELPPEYISKYFNRYDELFLVKDEVKKLVRFEVEDILDEDKPRNIDILFCRNTVIYFKQELKDKLYVDFHDALNKGGYLVLGMTEILSGQAKNMFKMANHINRIYKKE